MMRDIVLHGQLKKLFGPKHRFDVATAGEALRALACAFGGRFIEALSKGSYHVIRGRRHGGMALTLDLVMDFKLGSADLHIVPVAKGSSSKGTMGVIAAIAGVALVGTAIFLSGGTLAAPLAAMSSTAFSVGGMSISWGAVASLGLGVALWGASTLMAQTQTTQDEAKDQSYSFNGPVNVNEQGTAVPLPYGEVVIGAQAISAGMDVEDISAYPGALGSLNLLGVGAP